MLRTPGAGPHVTGDAMGESLVLRVAYDGTRFHGWARQRGVVTVQGTIESVLARVAASERAELRAASRTDAGVHAIGQVASVAGLSTRLSPPQLVRALGPLLPEDVSVTAIVRLAGEFEPRFRASSKVYRYYMCQGPVRSPFLRRFVLEAPRNLDLDAMAAAAAQLVGPIDMVRFAAHRPDLTTAPRRVVTSRVVARGDYLVYEVEGDAFVHHAVRRIVGTLLEVGRGRMDVADVGALARGGGVAGPTAPAHGLFLWRVRFPADTDPGLPESMPAELLHLPDI